MTAALARMLNSLRDSVIRSSPRATVTDPDGDALWSGARGSAATIPEGRPFQKLRVITVSPRSETTTARGGRTSWNTYVPEQDARYEYVAEQQARP